MYKLNFLDEELEVETFKTTYTTNDNLAVVVENDYGVECITVNLRDNPANENCAFIDTNNQKWAEKFLQDNKIAFPTGRFAISSFCSYPEYRFDMSKLKEYEDESDEKKKNKDDMEM